jgi:hypothetical protein
MADATVRTDDSTPKALDVPTTDVRDLVKPSTDGYYEDENFRPDPLAQYGTLDTSDTGGTTHQDVREISPVFAEAKAKNLATAARALDPDDDTPSELVVLPQGSVTVTGSVRSPGEARQEIESQLQKLAEEPLVLGGLTPGQKAAAEEDDTAQGRKDARESTLDGGKPSNTATTAESPAREDNRQQTAASRRNKG